MIYPFRFPRRVAGILLAGLACGYWGGLVRAGEPVRKAGEGDPGRVPFVRVFTRDDLAASPVNWQVAAHPSGLIYVTNNLGVLEYDGVTWRRVRLPASVAADVLAVDAAGRVWVSQNENLYSLMPNAAGLLEPRAETERIPAGARGFKKLKQAVATPEGLYLLAERQLLRVGPEGTVRAWAADTVFETLWWLDGALHVVQAGRPVGRLRGDGWEPVASVGGGATVGAAAGAPAAIGMAADGSVAWPTVFAARTEAAAQRTVLLTAEGPMTWRAGERPRPLSAESAVWLGGRNARDGTWLADGTMAFASVRHGLVVLEADGRLRMRVDRTGGLLSDRVNGVATDADGGLWLATPNGVARAEVDTPFRRIVARENYAGSVRTMARHEGKIYIGHAEGVSVFEPATAELRMLPGLPESTNGGVVMVSAAGSLLVAASGLRELTPTGELVRRLPTDFNSMLVSRREPNVVLAGQLGRGFTILAREDGAWRVRGQVKALADTSTVRMLDTGDGFVWGTTTKGAVWRADFRKGVAPDAPWRFFGAEEGVPETVRTDFNQVAAIGGAIVVGCDRYVLRFDPAAEKFVPETRITGLPPTGLSSMTTASDGSVWLRYSHFDGEVRGQTFRVKADGAPPWAAEKLPGAAMNRMVLNSYVADAGRPLLWLATQRGLHVAEVGWRASGTPTPLRVLVRRVTVNGTRVLHHGADVGAMAAPVLAAKESTVRFDYAATAFATDHLGQTRLQYRSRLEGFETEWSAWTTETHRTFTNLPGRAFAFRVQARDMAERVSEPASYRFSIRRPLWLTPWAIFGYIALGGGAVAGIVGLRTTALRRKAERLERVVEERTEDLRRQNHELARLHRLELDEKITARLGEEKARLEVLRYQLNPHFLFNALTSIRSQIPVQLGSARETVERLADFCRLTLHGRKPDERTDFAEEVAMLRAYLDIEQTRMGELLQVEFDVDPAVEKVLLPRLLLLPLVENALKYGQATSPDTLRLKITVRGEGEAVAVEVANTGAWVEHPAARGLPSLGIGHENLRERLARHYPDAHEFTHAVDAAAGWVYVRVRLRGPARRAGERSV